MPKFNIGDRIVTRIDNTCIPGFIHKILNDNYYDIKNYYNEVIGHVYQDNIQLINPNPIQSGSSVLILEKNGNCREGIIIYCLPFECFCVQFLDINVQKKVRLQNIIHIFGHCVIEIED